MRLAGVAVVATLVLAGCSAQERPEAAPVQPVQVEPGIWLAPGAGAVAGRVVSDAGLALPDARVSILGSEHFGRTDGSGAFRFVNVTSGGAELHVAATNFQPQGVPLVVPEQGVLRLNVTLLPDASAGAGYLPHVHDLWRGQQTYTMLDQDFDMTSRPPGSSLPEPYYVFVNGVYRPLTNVSRWVVPLAEAPEGNRPIVLPGTKVMEVTVSWDDPALDVLGLCMRVPGGKDVCHGAKPTPASWRLAVRPSEADGGHSRWTLWNMQVYHPPLTATARPATAVTEIHVDVELTRGNVPVDPPHPEFWSEGDTLLVHDERHRDASNCCSDHYSVRPDGIVPPGTQRLRIEHEWEFRGAGAGPLDFDYQLLLRTGAMNPHTTPFSQYLEPAPVEGGAAQQRKVYEVELAPGDSDAYYQQSSTWSVVMWNPLFDKDEYRGQTRETTHTLRITAHR